ncbi:MAG: energy coupling factor transporter S component ThiW [Lachnospiraceae bacterium]|nr:energy coupling factor transporter S component ThiW [Ruminococcus sp.]MCM1274839.1 energy coupling factor transporter S component ThiW [Lachnospiraceae bacterium]
MKNTNVRKLCMAAFLTALAVAGSLITFPIGASKCSPVQHMVNIIAGVYLGPWWAMGSGFCAALIRNFMALGTPLAFPGSMIGSFLSGVMYHWIFKNKPQYIRLPSAYVGELFGTSVLGGLLAYPVAAFVMGNKEAALFTYVLPFFVSCSVGTVIAAVLVTALKRVKAVDRLFGADDAVKDKG